MFKGKHICVQNNNRFIRYCAVLFLILIVSCLTFGTILFFNEKAHAVGAEYVPMTVLNDGTHNSFNCDTVVESSTGMGDTQPANKYYPSKLSNGGYTWFSEDYEARSSTRGPLPKDGKIVNRNGGFEGLY